MAGFDPYYKWLGIPPEEQPPTHYRLLGLRPLESDPEVIEAAADQKMAYVRQAAGGPHIASSQKLLNELAAARVCLLNPRKKSDYDRQLQARLSPAAATVDEAFVPPLPTEGFSGMTSGRRRRSRGKSPSRTVIAGTALGAIVPLIVLVVLLNREGDVTPRKASSRREPKGRPTAPEVGGGGADATKTVPPTRAAAKGDGGPARGPTDGSPSAPEEPPSATAVDLLKTIDPRRDAANGEWQFQNGALVTSAVSWGTLHVPQEIPGEYRLTVVAERTRRDDGLFFGLPVGDRHTALYLDAKDSSRSYLGNVDGRLQTDPYMGQALPDRRRFTVVCTVRRKGVEVAVDGRTIIDWKGDWSRLSMDPRWPVTPRPHRLFVGTWETQYRIHALEVEPAAAEPAETAPPVLAKGAAVDLLRQVDPRRDAVDGEWRLDEGGLTAPPGRFRRLQAPVELPPQYALELEVDVPEPQTELTLGITVGGRPTAAILDGHQSEMKVISGLAEVDGKMPSAENGTTRHGRVLTGGRPNTVVALVLKDRVQIQCDGNVVIDWRGDPQRLSLPGVWSPPAVTRPWLGSHGGTYRVTRWTLSPLEVASGPGRPAVAGPPKDGGRPEGSAAGDLLARVDLARHVVAGAWRKEDGALVVGGRTTLARVQLPVSPPIAYRLSGVVVPEEADSELALGLVVGGRQVCLIFGGTVSGLHSVDGRWANENVTRHSGKVLEEGRPNTVECLVAGGRIVASANGKRIVDWDGGPERLSVPEEWAVPEAGQLFVGSNFSGVRLERLDLVPVDPAAGPQQAAGAAPDAVSAGWGALAEGTRDPLPDEAALGRAEAEFRGAFGPEVAAARQPEERYALADKLRGEALRSLDDPAAAYVLLREARDLAARAGSAKLAFSVVNELAWRFDVDAARMKRDALEAAAPAARSPELAAETARVALDFAADMIETDRYDAAARAASLAKPAAVKIRQPALGAAADYYLKQARGLGREYEQLSDALATLEERPDDAEANEAAGRFYCLVKGDWARGLPLLARGADARLRDLAKQELGPPENAEEQAAVAEAWEEYASGRPSRERKPLERRARHWYARALPLLPPLKRAGAEKRIKDLSEATWELRVRATVDGSDSLFLSQRELRWQDANTLRRGVSLNEAVWDPTTPALANRGGSLTIPAEADVTTAKLTRVAGRGTVELAFQDEGVLVTFRDPPRGADAYEVVLTFAR